MPILAWFSSQIILFFSLPRTPSFLFLFNVLLINEIGDFPLQLGLYIAVGEDIEEGVDDFVFDDVMMLLFDGILVAEASDKCFVVVVGVDGDVDDFAGDFEVDCEEWVIVFHMLYTFYI